MTSIAPTVTDLILHVDILSEIVSYLEDDTSQLANILSVSRQFYRIAGPKLYRIVETDVAFPTTLSSAGMTLRVATAPRRHFSLEQRT